MRTRALALLLIVAACATTHAGKVAQVQTAYTEAATTLVNARIAGKIDTETWLNIKAVDKVVKGTIDDFRDGKTTYEAAMAALGRLEALLLEVN